MPAPGTGVRIRLCQSSARATEQLERAQAHSESCSRAKQLTTIHRRPGSEQVAMETAEFVVLAVMAHHSLPVGLAWSCAARGRRA